MYGGGRFRNNGVAAVGLVGGGVGDGDGGTAVPGALGSDDPDAVTSADKGCAGEASQFAASSPLAFRSAATGGRLVAASPDWPTDSGSLLLLAGAACPSSVLIGPLFDVEGGCGGTSLGCSL
jgi:hypothetical protein